MGKKKTHNKYVQQVMEVNSNIKVVETYQGNRTSILHQCTICGHKWFARPYNILSGRGCPECAKEGKISDVENKVYYYLKKYFNDTISGYSDVNNEISELDIYIPSLKFAIEYDGGIWHSDIERDKRKDQICQNMGIKLIRIREPECPRYESSCIFIFLQNHSQENLTQIITYILEAMGIIDPQIDFDNDAADINNLIRYRVKENSLAEKFPDIAKEWHPVKNGDLWASAVSYGSKKNIWWLCSVCGNEYVRRVEERTGSGYGCPICGREKTRQASCKAVVCLELNTIFESAIQAEREFNVWAQNISHTCKGKYQTTGKHPITNDPLHWYYVEDQPQKDGTIIKGAISLGLITQQQYEEFLHSTVQN